MNCKFFRRRVVQLPQLAAAAAAAADADTAAAAATISGECEEGVPQGSELRHSARGRSRRTPPGVESITAESARALQTALRRCFFFSRHKNPLFRTSIFYPLFLNECSRIRKNHLSKLYYRFQRYKSLIKTV
jgi:hypothetical protein